MSTPPPMHAVRLALTDSGEREVRTVCGLPASPRHPAAARPERVTCWACRAELDAREARAAQRDPSL